MDGGGSIALSINNSGQIVGSQTTASNKVYSILWEDNVPTIIFNTITSNNVHVGSRAYGINNSGQIVGYANNGDYNSRAINHAYLWTESDGMTDLGTLPGALRSQAYAINDSGQIVGFSSSAFIYDEGEMIELSTLLQENSGWSNLHNAYGINNSGQVVGTGFLDNGEWHAFLMTPVPEPVSPIADAGSNQTTTDTDDSGSEEVTLDGSGSSDSDGTIVSWVWTDDLGNTIPDGVNPTATLSIGTHTITLTITDDDGLTDTDTVAITVHPRPNQSPIANAGSDQTVGTEELVTLDGVESHDPDEDYPLSYLWQIISKPVGSVAALSNFDTITPSFTPDQLGNYTVELVVTDSLDAQSVPDTTSISVLNTPPDANANGHYTVYVGDTLTLDANGSTDPDDDIVSYLWDLDADDDGVFETDAGGEGVFAVDYAYLESLELLINHTYTIHLKVTDSEGQSDTAESTLTIVPKPAVKVAVDIKPGGCPNPVNTKSSGVLPVAILGSADVNVLDIDPTSIEFSFGDDVSVGAIRSAYEDVTGPVADSNDCNCIEAGPDGFLDLTLKFETQEIVKAIGDVNDGDILELELTGILYDPIPYETPIEGADCILIKGKHRTHNKADINKDGVVDAADFALLAQNWLQSIDD